MSPFVRKLARGMVLALILVLTGSANLLCFSVDNDDDDDTAPVSIELSFVALSPCSLPRGTATNSPAPNAPMKPRGTVQQTAPSQDSPHETARADFRPLRC